MSRGAKAAAGDGARSDDMSAPASHRAGAPGAGSPQDTRKGPVLQPHPTPPQDTRRQHSAGDATPLSAASHTRVRRLPLDRLLGT